MSPDTFDDFILQRSRWAQGMTQILVLNNPLFTKGLSLCQRLCYFNNCLFWFFGIARFIFYIAPALFLLFGMKVYFASVPQVLAYAIPHVIGSLILMDLFYGRDRWPFFSELFESIQSLFLMPVVLSVLVNPRKPSFKVTPKGKSLENDYLSALAMPFFIMCAILVAAVPVAIIKWLEYPLYRDVIAITLVWSLVNLILAMASLGAFFEKRQVRRHHRLWAKGKALVFLPRLQEFVEADLTDISMSGLGIAFKPKHPLTPLESIVVEIRDSHGEKFTIEARIMRQIQKNGLMVCGCEFLMLDEEQFATAVRFVYGDSQRWVDFWERRKKRAPNWWWLLLFVFRAMFKGMKGVMKAAFLFLYLPLANRFRLILGRTAA